MTTKTKTKTYISRSRAAARATLDARRLYCVTFRGPPQAASCPGAACCLFSQHETWHAAFRELTLAIRHGKIPWELRDTARIMVLSDSGKTLALYATSPCH